MKLLKAIGVGLMIEAAAVAVFWVALWAQGSRWAALFGLAALPVLAITFPPKQKGRR